MEPILFSVWGTTKVVHNEFGLIEEKNGCQRQHWSSVVLQPNVNKQEPMLIEIWTKTKTRKRKNTTFGTDRTREEERNDKLTLSIS